MSTTRIEWSIRQNGAPVNANSVELADPLNSFGVIRKDTNAVVVSANTPMVNDGVGEYSLEFTDPAPNLEYRYFVKAVMGDDTYHYERDYSNVDDILDIRGRYANSQCVFSRFGRDNIMRWAEYGGNETADEVSSRIRDKINEAAAYIDDTLRGGPAPVPFAQGAVPITIQEINCKLAGVYLYEARGIEDFEGFHRLAAMRRDCEDTLHRVRSGRMVVCPNVGEPAMKVVDTEANGEAYRLPDNTLYVYGNILRWPNT